MTKQNATLSTQRATRNSSKALEATKQTVVREAPVDYLIKNDTSFHGEEEEETEGEGGEGEGGGEYVENEGREEEELIEEEPKMVQPKAPIKLVLKIGRFVNLSQSREASDSDSSAEDSVVEEHSKKHVAPVSKKRSGDSSKKDKKEKGKSSERLAWLEEIVQEVKNGHLNRVKRLQKRFYDKYGEVNTSSSKEKKGVKGGEERARKKLLKQKKKEATHKKKKGKKRTAPDSSSSDSDSALSAKDSDSDSPAPALASSSDSSDSDSAKSSSSSDLARSVVKSKKLKFKRLKVKAYDLPNLPKRWAKHFKKMNDYVPLSIFLRENVNSFGTSDPTVLNLASERALRNLEIERDHPGEKRKKKEESYSYVCLPDGLQPDIEAIAKWHCDSAGDTVYTSGNPYALGGAKFGFNFATGKPRPLSSQSNPKASGSAGNQKNGPGQWKTRSRNRGRSQRGAFQGGG
ncbi:uncharacterized protein MELLADRAFT_66812 [Melampsora larici-populina 98AG31]|uniref:Uncharacterized protein n=1 Tax=Melampsora larici-populina (strain 98AG31 / pathotype 3-4-7) TaxID=747676 RepID=F4S0N9_MELLP|nr:uncharacterized protein MELLADRAFT_66812 [Melampsora larici-populina 98AG31]EGG01833.1 hypothetical protein MELLADRAFT_66812 [Melampsora larici-populina 98AG31]